MVGVFYAAVHVELNRWKNSEAYKCYFGDITVRGDKLETVWLRQLCSCLEQEHRYTFFEAKSGKSATPRD